MCIPAAPRGVPQIEVTFSIDSNSIHTVSAKDVGSGQSQSLQLNPTSGLGEKEVGELLAQAEAHASQDVKRRHQQESRNRLEGMIVANEKVFGQFSGLLDSDEQMKVRTILRQSRAALDDDEADYALAVLELNEVSAVLSTAMMSGPPE